MSTPSHRLYYRLHGFSNALDQFQRKKSLVCSHFLPVLVLCTDSSSEQLCATGTVGIAAVGLALGHPKSASDYGPASGKRKTPSRFTFEESQSAPIDPSGPSPPVQPTSTPISRLRKRTSFGRPLSSSSRLSLGMWTTPSISDTRPAEEAEETAQPITPEPHTHVSQPSDSPAFEFKGNSTVKPSWLRRKSTLSMSKDESPVSTPPPGSPSISFSNGSTAPILPSSTDYNSATLPRNKLVKRSTSQRALQGSNGMHSSLRRPATSHQRSATLQQHFLEDEPTSTHHPFASPLPLKDLREDQQVSHHSPSPTWHPFFKPQSVRVVKDGSSKKRRTAGVINRVESLKTIVPDVSELPTLMLAASITRRSSDDAVDEIAKHVSISKSPSSGAGFNRTIPLSIGELRTEIYADPEPTPRRSFTFSGMFPSPSPATWKIPRSGSVRKDQGLQGHQNSRRVVSAPHNMRSRQDTSHLSGDGSSNITRGRQPDEDVNFAPAGNKPPAADRDIPSAPLPPLNRLSAFEIDLPGAAPNYPSSPPLGQSPVSPPSSSTPPHSASSPLGPLVFNTMRNKSHRPSGAPSDHASTLLGSENSRYLSGDEDDVDGRSETVYDSTRTGATGSSHSGVRRPPIDTFFDKPPQPELSRDKLVALQDLIGHDSFSEMPIPTADILEEEESVSTPVRATAPCKEVVRPASVHRPTSRSPSPDFGSPPPNFLCETNPTGMAGTNLLESPNDDIWSFAEDNITHVATANGINHIGGPEQSAGELIASSPPLPITMFSHSPAGPDGTSRSNLFEWSEQPPSDKESFPGSSPRPKTVHGKNGKELRGSRLSGRRAPNTLHLRSQSVPVPSDSGNHRGNNNTSKLESWVLGHKGVSEDWDGDFEFEEPSPRPSKHSPVSHDLTKPSNPTGMLVPRSIMERQASVHGQFGQVKELTLLVEELKRLQHQAGIQGIMHGQSAELWKEAEGIINLATVDDEEQDFLPPHSPRSPSFDFDEFDEDSPAGRSRRRKSGISSTKGDRSSGAETVSASETPLQTPSRSSPDKPTMETPTPSLRPRKESAAKAKSVLENIHQQRSHYDLAMLEQTSQKKLPFDTTSLRDLVTRAGVVTRLLKEIVRQAENSPHTPGVRPSTPPDPPFSQIFQKTPTSPAPNRSPRVTQSPKSGTYMGGPIAGNDNEINGHMKIMTVV